MRDTERSRFFYIEGLDEWTKNIHLGYGVRVSEDTLKGSIFNAICEIKEEL